MAGVLKTQLSKGKRKRGSRVGFAPFFSEIRSRHTARAMSVSEAPPCVSDPLGAVARLFDAAVGAAGGIDALDADWGVRSAFQTALSQPGVLEKVRHAYQTNVR